MGDPEEETCLHPQDTNIKDVMGRTPLAWAACRGDDRAIVALLSHGADVNTLDVQHSAGADPGDATAHGFKVGNPLNVAARNAFDPLILKTLLYFGASVDSCGIDGMTAFIHASRKDNVSFATLLLEYGANINAVSTACQTPPTTAVPYNSHSVLRLLLNRQFEYSKLSRLTGPHFIYAKMETIAILTNTYHFHLKQGSCYALGDFMSCLIERSDATDKLIFAFDGLMDIIKRGPPSPGNSDTLSLMKSGLAYSDTSDSDGNVFENATESHYLQVECPDLCRCRSRIFYNGNIFFTWHDSPISDFIHTI